MIQDWMVMTWFFGLLFVTMALSEYKHINIKRYGIKTKRGTILFLVNSFIIIFIIGQFLIENLFSSYESLMMLLMFLSAYYFFRFLSTKGHGEGDE